MKHIFLINSHTQFLTALGVIELKRIPEGSIHFVYSRQYKNTLVNVRYETMDMSNLFENCKNLVGNFSKQNRVIFEIDSVVNQICGATNFKIYLPHLSYPFFQIFATNSKCVEVGLIQEAATAYQSRYNDKTPREVLYKLYSTIFLAKKRIWKTFSWVVPKFILDSRIVEAFEISDFFTPLQIKKTKVNWPKISTNYHIESSNPIFIFDSLVEHKFIEKDIYFGLVEKIVLENSFPKIYIKFHPSQPSENRISILNIIKKSIPNVSIEELPSEVPFEVILLNHTHLWICGFNSSLVDFASILGHNVKDYRDLLLISSLYRKSLKRYFS